MRGAQLTGLTAGALPGASGVLAWAAWADPAACDANIAGQTDDSMVLVNTLSDSAGLGLYTGTGPVADGAPGFLGPFKPAGQNGRGANAGIEGSFVTLREDWASAQASHPWAGGRNLRLDTVQAVHNLVVTAAPNSAPVQAKQQLTLGLLNPACLRESPGGPRPCQLKLMFTLAIARAGVTDWRDVPWFAGAHVQFDAGQGGIPVLDTPLPAAGQPGYLRGQSEVLFCSAGAPTQHGPFADQSFGVTVSFEQFGAVLRAVAAHEHQLDPAKVSGDRVAQLFGQNWQSPQAWVLMSTTLGQEVANPGAAGVATIGGHMRTLRVTAKAP